MDKESISKKIVYEISEQALNVGWKSSQLIDLTKTLTIFIPAKIGGITLQAIEIIVLHNDGTHRGCLRHYNQAVAQPWFKGGRVMAHGRDSPS